MQTIGLIGGMSWESTQIYYRLLNEGIRDRLGGLHSAQLLLYSVDLAPIVAMQTEARWADLGSALADAAERLERGGADFLLVCSNTMHQVADAITARVRIPLLHIADPTSAAIRARGLTRVGLLGTRFTMEQPFYRQRLADRFGLDVVIPPPAARDQLHTVIYDELCLGHILEPSRAAFRSIASGLVDAGAQGIILGCTEISLLLGPADVAVPAFDTIALHCTAAIDRALAG